MQGAQCLWCLGRSAECAVPLDSRKLLGIAEMTDTPLRILFVVLNYDPEPIGCGKYNGEFARSLAERGHDVRVICAPPYYPWWKIQEPYSAFRYKYEVVDGVKIIRCPLYIPKRLSGLKRIFHLLSAGLNFFPTVLWGLPFRPHVIFNVQPTLATSLVAYLLANLTGAKFWLHVQDIEVAAASKLRMVPKPVLRWAERIERRIYWRASKVSTISESMAEKLVQRGSPEKVAIFPNWVDTNRITPQETSSYRQELGISSDTFVALYAGNMGEKQGLEVVLGAAKILQNNPNIQFVLAGEGSLRTELLEGAHSLPNVRFLPLQAAARMSDFLALGNVHLVPQKAGVGDLVMPSKMTAILSAGRPSIVTALPNDELASIGDQCGISVLPGDVAGFANAIRYLASEPEDCKMLGIQARQYALDNLDSVKILGDMERFALELA